MGPLGGYRWVIGVLVLTASGCALEGPTSVPFKRSSLPRADTSQVDLVQLGVMVDGKTQVAFELYRPLISSLNNLVFSPFGVVDVVAQSWAGSGVGSGSEAHTSNVFLFNFDQVGTHRALNALGQFVGTRGEGFELTMIDTVWAPYDLEIKAAYLDTLAVNYGSGVGLVNFEQPEHVASAINEWVAEQSEDTIVDLVAPAQLMDAGLLLTSGASLRAIWGSPFDPANTTPEAFTAIDGTESSVDLMQQVMRVRYVENLDLQAVALPFRGPVGHDVELLVVMPVNLPVFENNLGLGSLNQLLSTLSFTDVAVGVPRLDLRSTVSLRQAIFESGAPTAFTEEADFSGISDSRSLHVADVIQQSVLRLDERGLTLPDDVTVEASGVATDPELPTMRLLRPFVIVIRDVSTGTVLFLGRVVKP